MDYIKEIFAYLRGLVELSNSINHTDININSENFYRDLLNLIYGYNLENLNAIDPNAAAIDLADKNARIAIQVTSTGSLVKTTKTVKKFVENELYKKYDRLIILNIVKKTTHREKTIDQDGKYTLDTKKDIWDVFDLIKKIDNKSKSEIEKIRQFLDDQVSTVRAHQIVLSPSGKIKSFFDSYHVSESGPIPFGGRDDELKLLNMWLNNSNASTRMLVTAPAGRGKSAILSQWYKSLSMHEDRIDRSKKWHVIFVPISIRFGTNQPSFFYKVIYEKLAGILGEQINTPIIDPETFYADQSRALFEHNNLAEQKILIIVDGIDEALGGYFDTSIFPNAIGPSVKILISARLQIGDVDSSGWLRRLDWGSGVFVQGLEIKPLGKDGIKDVLVKMGAPLDEVSDEVVGQLFRLTEGDPLMVRLYAEELWQIRDGVTHIGIQELNDLEPGFGPYFYRWLDLQRRAWKSAGDNIDDGLINRMLAVLAGALGPLESAAISHFLMEGDNAKSYIPLSELFKPLKRFILGNGTMESGYVLGHPKFGQYLRDEYFDANQVDKIQNEFANWGLETIKLLGKSVITPEQVPIYLLQFFCEHLKILDSSSDLFISAVSPGWAESWDLFEGGYKGFSRDVKAALNSIGPTSFDREQQSNCLQKRIKCSLFLSSIQSIGRNTPIDLIAMSLDKEIITLQQATHLIEQQEPANQSSSFATITSHLPDDKFRNVLESTLALKDTENSAQCLVRMALVESGERRSELLSVAWEKICKLVSPLRRATLLIELAPQLEENIDAIIHLVREATPLVESSQNRVGILARFAKLLGEQGRQEDAQQEIEQALEIMKEMEWSVGKCHALLDLLPVLPTDEKNLHISEIINFAEARYLTELSDIQNTSDPHLTLSRMETFGNLYLSAMLRRSDGDVGNDIEVQVIQKVISLAEMIPAPYYQVGLLVKLVPHVPDKYRDGFVGICFDKANTLLQTGNNRTHAMMNLAKCNVSSHISNILREGLQNGRLIEDSYSRLLALIELLAYLPEENRSDETDIAMRCIQQIQDIGFHGEALVKLAPLLPSDKRDGAFRSAINCFRQLRGGRFAAYRYANYLKDLPAGLQKEVFEEGFRESLNMDLKSVEMYQYSMLHSLENYARNTAHLWGEEHLNQALTVARNPIYNHGRAGLLCQLSPISLRLGCENTIDEAIDATNKIEGEISRIRQSISISQLMAGDFRAKLIERNLKEALHIKKDNERAIILLELLPHLSDVEKHRQFVNLHNIAQKLDCDEKAQCLLGLIDNSPSSGRNALIDEVLITAEKDLEPQRIIEIYIKVASHILDTKERLRLLDRIIEDGAKTPRSTYAGIINRIAIYLNEFGGEDLIRFTIREIDLVAKWLP